MLELQVNISDGTLKFPDLNLNAIGINSQINFNAGSLANLYAPLGKVNNKTIFTNIDNNLINPTTNQELNNFSISFSNNRDSLCISS